MPQFSLIWETMLESGMFRSIAGLLSLGSMFDKAGQRKGRGRDG
ncbi:hypothetical protein T260_12815 [Geobacillus thermopakistaniensis]|uniref:Uncharacterized protein n=1 Tax=Geobacillus thermopakistaniensis (strain MAS1) TaxID=1408282 RepID=A0A7U9J9T4_GEOTM|nr:hypothetical protein GA8_01340 [Geobacillus sp. A8]ESU71556.1 hypothetical protein T260_12815 [Geobacillus sp. MAS1]